jgi:hypothetical protein
MANYVNLTKKTFNPYNPKVLNEGQFSWMTQDTGQQIGSERENTIDVWMFDNQGNSWYEKRYEGYGEFGGMDYYELLARMNGYSEEDLGKGQEMRGLGIDLAFDKIKTKDKGNKVLFPALVASPKFNWKRHDFTKEADSDPNQSWYQEPEYDDYYESKQVTEGEVLLFDELNDKFDVLATSISELIDKTDDSKWKKALSGLMKQLEKLIDTAANHDVKLGAIETNESIVHEDWGSSDQNIMNKAIHKDAGSPKKMPSPFDSKLRAAAEDAVDFYWDDWEEYQTDRDGLIDNAVRGYLRSYFRKDWDLMVRMFEPMESVQVEESTEVNEANWGTYDTTEGKQVDKKLDKAFAKFKAAVSKAHATYRAELKALSNSELGNKSGFNDSEGGMSVASYLQRFVKSEFMMSDMGDISRFDYMKGMYEGMTWDGLKESLGLNERSINKISKEHAATVLDMSKTVEEWKAADGDRKAELLDKLKALTQKKKDLEKELDSAVAGKDKDLELAISETEKKTLDEGLESDIKKFIKNHRSELEDMADNDQWEDIHDMLYTEFDVQKDSRKAKDLIQTFEFMF